MKGRRACFVAQRRSLASTVGGGAVPPAPARARRRDEESTQGFALLEILVALTILGFALGVLMQIHTQGLHNVRIGDGQSRAVAVAEGVLTQMGSVLALEPGTTEGRGGGGYRWRAEIAQATREGAATGGLFDVTVSVEWQSFGAKRRTVLKSQRAVREP